MIFFDAVHAGDVHDAGHFLAGFAAGREMQERLDFFAVIGQLDALDWPAGILNELVVAGAFAFLPVNALRVAVFVDRPHGVGVETGGDVVVVARFSEIAGSFGLAALFFAARRRLGEFARDIDEFFNPAAQLGQIFLDAGAAVADDFPGAALIPVDAAGLNHLIQDPALFAPAFHFPFGFDAHGSTFLIWSFLGNEKQKFNMQVKVYKVSLISELRAFATSRE